MSNLNVLIVGASVAGPTAAYWFAKAGASVTIIERFPALRINGQGIDIRTASVTVMRKMPGMEGAVRSKTTQMDGIQFVHQNGKPYATMTATGDPDQQSLVSEFEIFRGDLAQILYDLTKDNPRIKYVFGTQVISMQHKDDGPITVEFTDKLPTSEYDLVVACDGSTSRTRAIGLGCGVRDHIRSLNCWAAFFSIEQDLLRGSKMGQSWSAVGGRWLAIGPDPAGVTRVGLQGIHSRKNQDSMIAFREAMKQGDHAIKNYIFKRFEGLGWKTNEILKGMMETTDFYANEIVQVKIPSPYKGRFVMVGDAGYAPGPTGGGTTLAIAGAYLLAGEVSRHKGDLAGGLKGYEERMKPIIKDMQRIPPGVPNLFAPQTPFWIFLRNLLFMFVAFVASSRISKWGGKILGRFFGSAFGSDKYGLPDYEWEN